MCPPSCSGDTGIGAIVVGDTGLPAVTVTGRTAEGTSVRFANPSDRDIVEWLPTTVPDRRIRYGTDPLQFGDLRLPDGDAPAAGHPVAVVLHGGGYSPNWNLDSVAPLSERLTTDLKIATWNLEYRRPGQVGGGRPGTWRDIADGIDHLRTIAEPYRLDPSRVIAVGHSAGATFAAWAAARDGIDAASPLFVREPLPLHGILSLAGILDLDLELGDGPHPPRHLTTLLTDPDAPDADHLRAFLPEVSPIALAVRITAHQRLVVGSEDHPDMVEQTRRYARACTDAGRPVVADHLDGANHFDVIDPTGNAWPVVAKAVRALLLA